MHSIPELIQTFREHGGKATPQRLMIVQALQGDTTHPTAEVIFHRVRSVLPTVSLTTVYKTLNELVSIGEVRRFDLNGVSHFDPNTEPHAEVVCLGCGEVVDLAQTAPQALPTVPNYDIVGQAQTFYGYCSRCGKRRPA